MKVNSFPSFEHILFFEYFSTPLIGIVNDKSFGKYKISFILIEVSIFVILSKSDFLAIPKFALNFDNGLSSVISSVLLMYSIYPIYSSLEKN